MLSSSHILRSAVRIGRTSTSAGRSLLLQTTRALAAGPSTGKHAVPQTNLKGIPEFEFQELFEKANVVDTPYYRLDHASEYVSTIDVNGEEATKVEPEALQILASVAMRDIAHLLRPGHLEQLNKITADPEASDNDKFVAMQLLKNANIAAGFVLPGCQDTGTAIVMGKRGSYVLTDGDDEKHLSKGNVKEP